MGKLKLYVISDIKKFGFYLLVTLSLIVLISFQNCSKVKFNTSSRDSLLVTQSCGSISMSPQSGIYEDTSLMFTVTPPPGVSISYLSWDFKKDTASVFTSTSNPVIHTFNAGPEGPGEYIATAAFMMDDGNGCQLDQAFQVLNGDLCSAPTGISGPAIGFAGEETSPFSVNTEPCFQGTVVWDMDNDGVSEYNVGVTDSITHIYVAPGIYTVKAIVINADDNSQTVLTHTIEVKYANCANGANNPPTCNICDAGKVLVNNQCVADCTNGATNPPSCNACPAGKILVNGQCVTPTNCSLPWGGTISHGQSVTAYQSSGVACGQTCASQTRTCNNGVLSGSYSNKDCSVGSSTPSTCYASPIAQQSYGTGTCAIYRQNSFSDMPLKSVFFNNGIRKYPNLGEYTDSFDYVNSSTKGKIYTAAGVKITYKGETKELNSACGDLNVEVNNNSTCSQSASVIIGGVTFRMGVAARNTIDPTGYVPACIAGFANTKTVWSQRMCGVVTMSTSLGYLPPPCP